MCYMNRGDGMQNNARRIGRPPVHGDELKPQIIATVRELITVQGFATVTMDDVAAKMGISKKTLYTQFTSREEMLEAAVNETLAGWDAQFRAIAADTQGNTLDRIARFMELLSICYSLLSKQLATDLKRYLPHVWEKIVADRQNLIFSDMRSIIEQGISEGIFRKDIHLEMGLVVYSELVESVLSPLFLAKHTYSAKELNSFVSMIFLRSIFTEEGRSLAHQKGLC